MAKIRLYTTAIVVLSSTDAVLQQYGAGNYALDASGQAITVSGNGVKARFPNLSEITVITDADGNPVTLPGTQAEYVTLIAGYFRSLASSGGGGGGGSVTVTNFPADYPDALSAEKLAAIEGFTGETNNILGTAGTNETTNIPDSASSGTGLRKLLYKSLDLLGLRIGFNENANYPDDVNADGFGIRKLLYGAWQLLGIISTSLATGTGISSSSQNAPLARVLSDSLQVTETLTHTSGSVIFATTSGRAFQGIMLNCISATGTCNFVVEFSHDGTTWASCGTLHRNTAGAAITRDAGATTETVGANLLLQTNMYRAYVRIRATTTGTGSSVWQARFVSTPLIVTDLEYLPVSQYSQFTTSPAGAPGASVGTLPGVNTKIISAATTNATAGSTGNRTITQLSLGNSGASWAYFKLYNKASAPTVGIDPVVFIFPIPPGQTINVTIPPNGIRTGTLGLAWAITGGAADADTTAIAANQVTGTIIYV